MKSQLLRDTKFMPFTHLKVKIWAILLPYPLYFGPEIGSCGVYNGNIEAAIKKIDHENVNIIPQTLCL